MALDSEERDDEQNGREVKDILIKGEFRNMFFHKDDVPKARDLTAPSTNCTVSEQEIYNELLDKIKNINDNDLCGECRGVVSRNEKGNIQNESSIFKSKPTRIYNCYNLTPVTVGSDVILSSSMLKTSKKFEVSKTKKTRKMDRDCIHKKIKARLFKFVKDHLKKLIHPDLAALKIPQNIISDVTFGYNQKLLERTLQSIFSERYYYFNDPEKNIRKIVMDESKIDQLKHFLNKTVKESFEQYLQSEQFENDVKKKKAEE